MSHIDARPLLFVISGPSGSGKGTAVRRLHTHTGLRRVATYTTREPRAAEVDGLDYHFVDDDRFHRLHEQGTIFEYTRTYRDSLYGSPASLLDSTDRDPYVVELDPAGFVRTRAASARRVVGIFITTVSEGELRRRIAERGQGREAAARMRIRTDQLTWAWSYDYVLLNDDLDAFHADLDAVVRSELLRTAGARRLLDLRAEIDPTLNGADPRQ
jgi:guanylate kinase